MAPGFLSPLLDSPDTPHALCSVRTGGVIAARLLSAFDSESRRRGLLTREGLDAGTALVLAPCEAIHTFFMRFPIDVAFVTSDGEIVGMRHALRPWRMAFSWRAFATIELAAGSLAAAGARRGDRVIVLPAAEIRPAVA